MRIWRTFFRYRVNHDLGFARVVLYAPLFFAFDNFVDPFDDTLGGREGVQLCIVVDVDVFVEKDYGVQIVLWVLFQ